VTGSSRARALAHVGLLLVFVPGCPRHPPPGLDAGHAGADAARAASPLALIGVAEDRRRAPEVLEEWRRSPDPQVRRRAIRALARIADADGAGVEGPLLAALSDEDDEVVAWAAYGLGWTCKGKEAAYVKALAARLASLTMQDAAPRASSRSDLDPVSVTARAIGRCGGGEAEGVLLGLLRAAPDRAEEVAYALGSVAGRRVLSDETLGALLDLAEADPPRPGAAAALFPVARLDHIETPWALRVLKASRAVLARPSPLRAFAIRALEKAGLLAVGDLGRAAADAALTPEERADAARVLGRMGAQGHEAAAGALARTLRDHATVSPEGLMSDGFNALLALVQAVGADAPKNADEPLRALAALAVPASNAPLARRTVALRCAAGAALARAAFDAEVLTSCDPDGTGVTGELARLAALLRRPVGGERLKALRTLAASPRVKVREAALEAVALHPELGEHARAMLVAGLAAPEPGVVATAAETIVQHPERVLTLAASERRAALDPRAPPPTSHPAMDLPHDVAAALTQALAHAWAEDLVETRTALLDAAVAVSLPQAKDAATRACADANVTVREHASKALRALGAPQSDCPLRDSPRAAAAPDPPVAHPVRVAFETDAGKLAIVFEPDLAPLGASRFVALARAGFYKGIVVHRVVPGYVVQFGDPGGDGYGGSGALLRCETSPVAFGPLDVGVALAGRDTGSSQVFVSLGRYPKLDGDYARVGRAEGDWGAVAEGDIITAVKVEE